MNKNKISELRNRIKTTTSTVISVTTNIEYLMQLAITKYFTSSRKDYELFNELFFSPEQGLFWNKLTKLLDKFISKTYPKFLQENPKFISDLERLGRFRNKFAHSFSTTNHQLSELVGKSYFVMNYMENGEFKTHQFAWNEIEEKYQEIRKLIKMLEDLEKYYK